MACHEPLPHSGMRRQGRSRPRVALERVQCRGPLERSWWREVAFQWVLPAQGAGHGEGPQPGSPFEILRRAGWAGAWGDRGIRGLSWHTQSLAPVGVWSVRMPVRALTLLHPSPRLPGGGWAPAWPGLPSASGSPFPASPPTTLPASRPQPTLCCLGGCARPIPLSEPPGQTPTSRAGQRPSSLGIWGALAPRPRPPPSPTARHSPPTPHCEGQREPQAGLP